MPIAMKLKNWIETPPGGYRFKHPTTGQEFNGITTQVLERRWREEFGVPPPPNFMQMIETDTCEYLETQGLHDRYFEHIPSIVDQEAGKITKVDSQRLLKPGDHYFNAGLVEIKPWLTMIYRREQNDTSESDICACWLDDDYQPILKSNRKLDIPMIYEHENFEDPRVILYDKKFLISFCSWQRGGQYMLARQRLVLVDRKLNYLKDIDLNYGTNKRSVEKNWSYFLDKRGQLMMLYRIAPTEVVLINPDSPVQERVARWEWKPIWKWGEIRGGTPPILVGDEYYVFYHSRYGDEKTGTPIRYVVGCFTFDAVTFKPKRYTPSPMLRASEKDERCHWKPLTVFPVGAVFRGETLNDQSTWDTAGKWVISMGINDVFCAIWEINHEQLQTKLIEIN
jgi:predicted GH43/DUF377 family glycosyl hydrolase